MNTKSSLSLQTSQRGAALITALIILVALTVIGVSAFKTSNLEELIVGNLRDKQVAFQAAESALRDAEDDIAGFAGIPTPLDDGGTKGVFTRDRFGDYSAKAYDTALWASATPATTSLGEVKTQPVFVIEYEAFYPDDLNFETRSKGQGRYYYRITARGVGTTPNSATLLQETFGKRYR
jgi:type IV pilus assembly protein PilX